MWKKLSSIFLTLYTFIVTYVVLSFFFGVEYQGFFTPLSTLLAFSFALNHGIERLGRGKALLLLGVTAGISLLFECVGVATGLVYGPYAYTERLGVKVLGLVPLIIPVAWFMMSYPAFIITSRVVKPQENVWAWRVSFAAVGALVMTAWDVAMDPMMVAAGHWVWQNPGPFFGIPLQNYWGWWLTIFVAFLTFLTVAKITPDSLRSLDNGYDRQAVLSYGIAGLSTVLVCLQVGLEGPALAGFFAMAPWVILGLNKQDTSRI